MQFSSEFAPAVKEVVEFAKKIPNFMELEDEDQIQLMKSGAFEVQWFELLRCNIICYHYISDIFHIPIFFVKNDLLSNQEELFLFLIFVETCWFFLRSHINYLKSFQSANWVH